ncbi:30S ribosomal protein S9 [candidate division MSBL1 archaeon SCGC-AAA261F17]|uniref:Small ribosomal subunit protein uS9 n=1 Tax=candidate division MSBL1 archaeon SCGC-AAA261F17 TaxID=1698274 RepID=A0A133V5S4_9EURY|nr:30S ribosomal protein S9 [candidate division MSBL1 archaeon SCGC-AAA261F17]
MKVIQAVGRRKSAIARATVKNGSGNVYINNHSLEVHEPELARLRIEEPLQIAPEVAEKVDVKVNVSGGGFMGQADATRTAIAKALTKWADDEELREKFKEYDWAMIKSDTRRKESKKPGGPGARRKRQKSYR